MTIKMIVFICLLFSIGLRGQSDEAAPQPSKEIIAIQIDSKSLVLDGTLREKIWQSTPFAGQFIQRSPNEGKISSRKTEVRVAYDHKALYIGARMYCEDPDAILARVSRRDAVSNSERLIISLDTYHDRRTAYSFGITPSGVRVDYYHPSDEEFGGRDYTFDPIWEAKARIDSEGWTTEIRIPFSQLRFNDLEKQIWGININRWMPDINEDAYWIYIPSHETGWASHFGLLTGIQGIKPSRRLELLPYVSSDLTLDNTIAENDPFRSSEDLDGRAGLDIKMGLGPNLTLDATVSPDFGQVEADPAEVNLSAFETFFSERRPFFTEGDQLLQGFGPGYYYSRRIGAAPHVSAKSTIESLYGIQRDFADIPSNSTILGASKLTGRLNSGISIGALTAVTAREFAPTADSTLNVDNYEVEPLSGYGVLRLQQEFGKNASAAGITLTGVQRDLPESSPLSAIINRQAFTGGGDWNLRFSGGKYVVGGHLGFSHISGTEAAILQAQRSSARYFQRPDVDYVTLDSTRTSLGGYTGSLSIRKNSGRHWLWRTLVWLESPGFELNDIGRLRSADGISTNERLIYRETVPGKLFRNYSVELGLTGAWNFGGERQATRGELELNATFLNFWRTELELSYFTRAQSMQLTRGGPSMGFGQGWAAEFELGNNFAASTRWNMALETFTSESGDWVWFFENSFAFHPGDQWEFSMTPLISRQLVPRQYIGEEAGGSEATFGRRYIFATIDQRLISSQFRLNYTFTPNLSLELYAEPFAAKGTYTNFGELEAARSRFLRIYGNDGTTIALDEENALYEVTDGNDSFAFFKPDFNLLSFRSNVVLRWEWRPGSSLFLVWQQDRSGVEPLEENIGLGSLYNSLSSEGNQFFALKLSYWLPVN